MNLLGTSGQTNLEVKISDNVKRAYSTNQESDDWWADHLRSTSRRDGARWIFKKNCGGSGAPTQENVNKWSIMIRKSLALWADLWDFVRVQRRNLELCLSHINTNRLKALLRQTFWGLSLIVIYHTISGMWTNAPEKPRSRPWTEMLLLISVTPPPRSPTCPPHYPSISIVSLDPESLQGNQEPSSSNISPHFSLGYEAGDQCCSVSED